ncbi:hypothetical protein FG93_01943 [Bosea sp. LC85]|uniref:hypothetical protein n=1 Tax=Bosea sp. LC85 TaxID=1502851 RepID=UPI0004E2DD6C|nr:hypothetical protein [Bosea sp. LC85]KFC73199.1 hypothetical protein FG93_01943 [Bosea sp. LC85]
MTSRLRAVSLQFQGETLRALAGTQADLAAFARREHGKVMRADPRPSSYRRFVDGREGALEESVQRNGVIEYHYQRLDEIVRFAMDTLFALSPVLSGDYRRAHTLFVGGVAVGDLRSWKPQSGEEIYILNPLPYARKIDLGKMKMRVAGTDRVYQQAEQILKRRFGNMAAIKFTFRSVVGGSFFEAGGVKRPIKRGVKGRFAKGSHARPGRALEKDARRPALYIRVY